jgi:hypothetical protein
MFSGVNFPVILLFNLFFFLLGLSCAGVPDSPFKTKGFILSGVLVIVLLISLILK